jgi:hypothetical protein
MENNEAFMLIRLKEKETWLNKSYTHIHIHTTTVFCLFKLKKRRINLSELNYYNSE